MALMTAACTDSEATPATVETKPATGVTDVLATLEGSVADSTEETISYWFEYGSSTAYGSKTERHRLEITGQDDQPVSEDLSGLTSETTYHYRTCTKEPTTVCGADRSFTTAPSSSITSTPVLYPGFDPAISDYVTRCGAGPVTVTVAAPSGTDVAVGGASAHTGRFTQGVDLTAGERFEISTTTSGRTSTFHVRCLPDDFPTWTYNRPGDPSASFYITTPQNVATPSGQPAPLYIAIFDDHGVPVWWKQATGGTDAKLFPDGTLGWGMTEQGTFNSSPTSGFEIHRLDGSLVHTWRAIGAPTDFHDFQLLPNGNALIGAYPARPGTLDLTAYGGPSTNGTLLDGEIQEVTADGTKVWSWSTKDHIDPSETPARWRAGWVYGLPLSLDDGRQGFDWAHLNSIHQVGSTVVVSFRHLDAVYAINKDDGEIIWKLGGTPTSKSLAVRGDPESNPLGGQHDARLLPDGTVTIYDNNSMEHAAPRAVRYRIDLGARTATMLESANDPHVATSPCCGSATELADGSWLVSWGGTLVISELGPSGDRRFDLTFTSKKGSFGTSYRVAPIAGSSPTVVDLRAGMDAMR